MKERLPIKDKKILRMQILFLILSFGLVVYSIYTELILDKIPYFLLSGWFLSVFSSTFFSFLLNWRRSFLTFITGVLFLPFWFLMVGLGGAFSSQQPASAEEVIYTFLIMMTLGYIIYFALILKTEGYSGLQWKQLW